MNLGWSDLCNVANDFMEAEIGEGEGGGVIRRLACLCGTCFNFKAFFLLSRKFIGQHFLSPFTEPKDEEILYNCSNVIPEHSLFLRISIAMIYVNTLNQRR